MRNYDEEREQRHQERERLLGDRSFIIGGETFVHKFVVATDVLKRIATPKFDVDGGAFIQAVEDNVLDLIEDEGDAHERFIALLKRKENPVTFEDLQILCTSLVEDSFARPTEASSPSGDGREQTGTSSTESTSTEPAEGLAA